MKFQFLGTGNASQVPCYGCECPACVRAKTLTNFRRGPCSAKIETASGTLLIDAGNPNLTERFPAGSIHSILLTHYHMDHVQGLFSLRWGKNQSINVFGPDDSKGCDDLFKHPGILDFQTPVMAFREFIIDDLRITPVPLVHSKPTVGYLFCDSYQSIAYLTDTLGLPVATENFLIEKRPDVVIIDCSYPPTDSPRNHNSLTQALAIIERINPYSAYLTHIGHNLDAYFMREDVQLPSNVFIAKDNQTLLPQTIGNPSMSIYQS